MASLKYKDPTTGEWKKVKLGDSFSAALVEHANNKNNPHKVTASQVGAAPAYTYGTEDLEEGVTPLATGVLHFVYE
jgi:hypothetical protein